MQDQWFYRLFCCEEMVVKDGPRGQVMAMPWMEWQLDRAIKGLGTEELALSRGESRCQAHTEAQCPVGRMSEVNPRPLRVEHPCLVCPRTRSLSPCDQEFLVLTSSILPELDLGRGACGLHLLACFVS